MKKNGSIVLTADGSGWHQQQSPCHDQTASDGLGHHALEDEAKDVTGAKLAMSKL
jgi:hypothetical protein